MIRSVFYKAAQVACLLFLVPVGAHAFDALDLNVNIPYELFKLDNGLTVIVHEDHKAPVVAVNVWYHVGSKDEVRGKTGYAHLFEHLMFKALLLQPLAHRPSYWGDNRRGVLGGGRRIRRGFAHDSTASSAGVRTAASVASG